MRKLRRFLVPALSILLGLAFTFTSVAFADTVTVTTTSDVVDGTTTSIAALILSPGADGKISLREAITAANNTPGADEILFDSSLNGTPITLTGAPHDNSNLSGDLDIRSDMTIRGNGKSLTIIQAGTTSSNGVDRVFDVFAPASTTITVTIENLTVRHGRTGISGVALVNRGAGISVHADNLGTANLNVTDALVTLNTNLNASGGGIDIIKRDNGSVPTLNILRSEISENSSFQSGGGVICTDGDLTLTESLVSNNFSNENTNLTGGAGIFMGGPEATTATITNTTITGNRTNGSGAGIVNSNDTVILDFVTVTLNIANDDNDALGLGGGLRQIGGSGSITVNNSIVQGNTTNGNAAAGDCSGTITSGGFNVVGAGAGFPVGPNDTTGDANLGPLQNNGGSTKTHALLCPSAAIDFADCGSITTDQISNPRNDGSCDAGAYERQSSASNVVTVTTADDAVDGNLSSIDNLIADPGPDGVISLREAISAANHTNGADEIQFSSGINTIPIVLDLTGTGEDGNVDGDLDLLDCDGLTITGNGESSTILDGNNDERVMDVLLGDLTIIGLTIRNGDETANSSAGGGILVRGNGGDLTVDQCTIADNVARFGTGIEYDATGGSLSLTNSTFTGNDAFTHSGSGFRFASTDGSLFVDNCIVTGNTANLNGAGLEISASSATAEISNSIISGNTATGSGGGGIRLSSSSTITTIRNCEISNNMISGDGGGVGMVGSNRTLTVLNSTISGNSANGHGGGISLDASNAVVNLNFVTITNNIADGDADGTGEGGGIDITATSGPATVNIHNSIVQGNDDETPAQTSADDCGNSGGIGTYISQDGNVFGSGTGCPVGVNDTTDPANLGPLQNNGGSTETHALLAGSAAIDFADCDTVTTDQRDFVRNDGSCDAGAFEFAGGSSGHCFIVINTNNAGGGSLRQAILDANATPNLDASTPDTIKFNIAGAGPHTISPISQLPLVTDAVFIDGTTQPGADCSSWPPTLQIELDGTNAGFSDGLTLLSGASGSTIRGLVINRFDGNGILLNDSDNNLIECNFIGTDVSGTSDLGNSDDGIRAQSDADNNTIGGTTPSARNLISANGDDGIDLTSNISGTLIQGNYIGTDVTGTLNLGNKEDGVCIFSNSDNNTIGGTTAGAANIIAYNAFVGVIIESGIGNRILGNSIFNNGALGIDLDGSGSGGDGVTANDAGDGDTGPNNFQNFPVLTSAETDGSGSITITGTFNSTPNTSGFRLEFFGNTVCNGDQDGVAQTDDNGEGETFLGFTTVSTDGSGDASFSVTLSATVPVGAFITATATAPDNSTSEFSQCVEAVSSGKPFVFLANKITLESTKQVPSYGDMHSNGTLTVEKGDPSTYNSNLTAVGKITIGKYNTINGDVTSQTSISNSGTINGTKTIGPVNTEPLPSLSYSAGGPNKTLSNGGSLSLAPGSYGIVTLNENSTLKLTSGEYFMNELRYSSTIKNGVIEIDLSSGNPVTINVVSNLQLGHDAAIILLPNGEADSKLVTFNTLQTTNAYWGREGYLVGSFNAPNAVVTLVKNTQLRGAICAKEIYVSTDCLFLHHDSPGSLPGPGNLPKPSASEVATSEVVTDYALEQNYPNPFSQIPRFAGNPSTTISFALPQAGEVSLAIYNTNGQLVKKLIAGEMEAGRRSVVWDATNARGERVSSGVYLYVLKAGDPSAGSGQGFTAQRKLVLMK